MLTSDVSAAVRARGLFPRLRTPAAVAAVVLSGTAVVLLAAVGYGWAPAFGSGLLAAIAVGTVVDRDRRALAEARSLFAIAFLNSPSGLAIVDGAGQLERANGAFADLFRLTGTSVDKTNVLDL